MAIQHSEMTQPWWDAVAQHRLTRPVCNVCGRSFFSPSFACPHCRATDWDYVESAGVGRVYSHTTVYRPPTPEFEAPYVLGIVDLVDEGWSMLTRVVGCDPEEVEIGMSVQLAWGPVGTRTMPVFEPVA